MADFQVATGRSTALKARWNEAEVNRVANRREVTVEVLKPEDVPAAAMAEAPIYRGGEQLQPWQRSFVMMFLEHREMYGKASTPNNLLAFMQQIGKRTRHLILGDGAPHSDRCSRTVGSACYS